MTRRRFALVIAALTALALAALLFFAGTGTTAPEPPDGPNAAARAPSGASPRAPGHPDASPPNEEGQATDEDDADNTVVDPDAEISDEALAALIEQLEADPNTHVACDLALPVRRSEGYLAVGGHSDINGRRVQVAGGKAYLPLVYDMGELADVVFDERSGHFSLDGYGPVGIAWSDPPEGGGLGRCTATIEPESSRASLTGTLTLTPSGAPAAGAWIEGCGNMAFADQHGVVHMDIVNQPCAVLAMRQDGLLRSISEVVQITPQPGIDVIVDITIPEAQRAGLGVQVSMHDEGIVIDGLVDGGPAGEAGLLEGDLVVAVDGEPLEDLGEFVQAVGGTAGTDVTLSVQRGEDQLDITITRQVLTQG